MARFWTEPVDPGRHLDHFHAGGAVPRTRAHGGELAYFVRVVGFTFEFASIAQVRGCLAYLAAPIHPTSRAPVFGPEKGEWQAWHDRLPSHVRKGSKRERVVRALREAITTFTGEPS